MQHDSVAANPIFAPAGEAVVLGLYLAVFAAVALTLTWLLRRRRRAPGPPDRDAG
jgi:hypothetical protein